MTENPFRTLSSSRPYVDARIAVRRDEFEVEGGYRGVHLVLEIPEAVCVVPVLPDGRLLLIRQWRYTVEAPLWEVPAGRIHEGETAELAARRELREETGHEARVLQPLGRFFPMPGISSHVGNLFAAIDCEPRGALELEPTERIEVHTFARDAVADLFARFAIVEGFTVAALGRYLLTSQRSSR